MIAESRQHLPVVYLPTGDRALVMAWAVVPTGVGKVLVHDIQTVLCLEDGTAAAALLSEIKFDFRYDVANDRWVDVSRISGLPDEGGDVDTDQGHADDGRSEVPG